MRASQLEANHFPYVISHFSFAIVAKPQRRGDAEAQRIKGN
jgi:hypothetical protein